MKYSLILSFFLLALTAHAQVLRIDEMDPDGKSHRLDRVRKIADINSQLSLVLQKDSLLTQLGKRFGPATTPLASRFETVQLSLEKRSESLLLLKNTLAQFSDTLRPGTRAFDDYLENLNRATAPARELLNDSLVEARFNALDNGNIAPGTDALALYTDVFNAAAGVVQETRDQLTQLLRERGTAVRMGAWLVTQQGQTPIHLPGFDDFEEGERFVVSRFVLLTDEEKTRFQAFDSLSRQIERNGFSIRQASQAQLAVVLEQLRQSPSFLAFRELRDTTRVTLERLRTDAASPVGRLLTQIQTSARGKISAIENLIARYRRPATPTRPPLNPKQVLTDVDSLGSLLTGFLKREIPQWQAQIAALPAAARQALRPVEVGFTKVKNSVEGDLTQLKNQVAAVGTQLNTLLRGASFDAQALQFGTQVRRFALDSLPGSTAFSLLTTGRRSEGDYVLVKVQAETASARPIDLAAEQIHLFKVVPHVETVAGIIFAAPYHPNQTQLTRRFQTMPSYSVLVRGLIDRNRRRKSIAYHNLMDVGIGLNAASLDFNKDDVPELGLGLVVSVFRDYIQAGTGYNIHNDNPYWFFGIRLPLPFLNLSSSGRATPDR
ncbi:MAG: hypothetical protein H7Y12_09715 [Sphingobacteriaceae bacterium]|nr:hypothetical protein [Cytophagaceae bacterium]